MSRKIGKGVNTRYKCLDCHSVFSEEDTVFYHYDQHHPYGEGYAAEEMCEAHCPRCDSEELKEYFE